MLSSDLIGVVHHTFRIREIEIIPNAGRFSLMLTSFFLTLFILILAVTERLF